jgi:hypothetical protein
VTCVKVETLNRIREGADIGPPPAFQGVNRGPDGLAV